MQKNWGDGTVYQESVNKWTAKISLGTTPDGKALFKRFSARTKGEVEKKLKASSIFRKSPSTGLFPAIIFGTLHNGLVLAYTHYFFIILY